MTTPPGIPLATLKRLPMYLKIIKEAGELGSGWISSELLASKLGFGAIQVRKDLSSLGLVGSPRRGFPIEDAVVRIETFLGASNRSDLFLVGAGPLGAAALADQGILEHGFSIVAVFDRHPDSFASEHQEVLSMGRLRDLAKRMGIRMAILAATPDWAQEAADELVAAGFEAVLDLSGLPARFPPPVAVSRVNLGADLAYLQGRIGAKG